MIARMGEVLQDNYPEVVKRSFIINGNSSTSSFSFRQSSFSVLFFHA